MTPTVGSKVFRTGSTMNLTSTTGTTRNAGRSWGSRKMIWMLCWTPCKSRTKLLVSRGRFAIPSKDCAFSWADFPTLADTQTWYHVSDEIPLNSALFLTLFWTMFTPVTTIALKVGTNLFYSRIDCMATRRLSTKKVHHLRIVLVLLTGLCEVSPDQRNTNASCTMGIKGYTG